MSRPPQADSTGWRRRRARRRGRRPAPVRHALGVEDPGAAPPVPAATRTGTCSRERPRPLPPRRRGLRSSFRSALEHEGLVDLDDPAKAVRRLTDRLQEAVAPAVSRTRRNPAALGGLDNRLPFGQGLAEGQPALLVVQAGQRCAGEGTECLAAGLAAVAPQTARLAPRDGAGAGAMRAAPLVVHAELDRRKRILALRPSRQRRRDLLALRRRQIVHTREPVPKSLLIHPLALPETNREHYSAVPTNCQLSLTF